MALASGAAARRHEDVPAGVDGDGVGPRVVRDVRHEHLQQKNVLGRPKRCQLAHASLWEYSYRRMKLAQLLGQVGVFFTCLNGGE